MLAALIGVAILLFIARRVDEPGFKGKVGVCGEYGIVIYLRGSDVREARYREHNGQQKDKRAKELRLQLPKHAVQVGHARRT